MADITITHINETWMKVQCAEIYMELDLHDRFKFEVPGAKYDIRVKKGQWDGFKKLYNRKTKRMYCGLLFKLLEFCEQKGWSTHIDPDLLPSDESFDEEDLDMLIEFVQPHSKGNPIKPYDYQREAVKYMMTMDRTVPLAATSAGKSLILYLAARAHQLLDSMQDKRIFIIVPSKSLVEQLYADFEDYSSFPGSNWSVANHCQKISGKYSKFVEKPIVITTWQSMDKLPHFIYEDMGAVFVDEVHTASANVLTNIIESAVSTKYRHGVTGTLDGTECNELVIEGLLGPVKRIVKAKELIDKGRASRIEVRMSMIKYPERVCQKLAIEKANVPPKQRFHKEVEFVNELDYRREFIFSMIKSMPGNSLVLFDRVEGYGKELYESFKAVHENTFLIIGETEADEREYIRNIMEQYDDAVIFASYGTMQVGVSIKKLHNLFLVSSSKSVIRVLQSIGRLMRLHDTKDVSRIFDIVDNLSFEGRENYMLKHAMERIQYYDNEEFDIEFDEYDIRKFMNKENSIDDFL